MPLEAASLRNTASFYNICLICSSIYYVILKLHILYSCY